MNTRPLDNQNMRERLIELFKKIKKEPAITCPVYKTDKTCKGCKYSINDFLCNHIERQVDYLLANGVIVPPCKVGDTIYQLCKGYKSYVLEYEVIEISILEDFIDIIASSKKCPFAYPDRFSSEQFGKTVFLTKEEAEQALKDC